MTSLILVTLCSALTICFNLAMIYPFHLGDDLSRLVRPSLESDIAGLLRSVDHIVHLLQSEEKVRRSPRSALENSNNKHDNVRAWYPIHSLRLAQCSDLNYVKNMWIRVRSTLQRDRLREPVKNRHLTPATKYQTLNT